MISTRRNFIKKLSVGFVGGTVLSSLPSSSNAKKFEKGIQIDKDYIVFNENTQTNMEALAEALMPGSKEIGMRDKVMNYVNSDRGAATIFDAGLWNLDSLSISRYKKHFFELTDKEDIDKILKYVKAKNTLFFNQFRYLIIRFYYADPKVWKQLSYNGPPQPKGFLDYSEAPKK